MASLRTVLERSASGSSTELIGSLASGNFDDFSDIDVRWLVGSAAAEVMSQIDQVLGRVDRVASLRVDPDTRQSSTRQLLFVRFVEWPLFWRVDIEIDGDFSAVDTAEAWSVEESALMNAVGALKALRRGQPVIAAGLLRRGFDRIHADDPGGHPLTRLRALTCGIAAQAPQLDALAVAITAAASEDT